LLAALPRSSYGPPLTFKVREEEVQDFVPPLIEHRKAWQKLVQQE
jgi:hypothetical protein